MNGATDNNLDKDIESFSSIKDNKKKPERSRSKILAGLNRFTAWFYSLFIGGLIGGIFTIYKKMQKYFAEGLISSVLGFGSPLSSYFAKLRLIISRSIEQSRILKFISKKLSSLMCVNLSVYGLFLMIFGGLSAVFGIIDSGLSGVDILASNEVLTGGILVISSFVLMTSSKTLAMAIKDGAISRKIVNALGIPEEALEKKEVAGRESVLIAILFGVLFGSLSYFTSPIIILIALLSLVGVYLTMKHPEIGVMLTFFFTPLSLALKTGHSFVALLVCITLASYLIKVLCGRRMMKLELVGVFVLIFAILLGFGGTFSAGGAASRSRAIIMFCFAFSFVALVNLLRSKAWLARCMYAMASSLLIISLVTVLEVISMKFGFLPLLLGEGTAIYEAISLFLVNREAVSAYIVMLFPILVFFLMRKGRLLRRFVLLVGMLAAVFSVVYLGSRPAWLGLLVGILLFMILYSHKTLTAFLIAAFPIACAIVFIPHEWKIKIFDYFKFSNESVLGRIDIWDGGLRMIREYLLGGIGVGKEAFAEVYPIYANPGFEGATSLYNVFLQLLASIGVFGFVLFAVVLIVYLQKSFSFMKQNENKQVRLPVLVCLCSTVSLLTMGIANDVFAHLGIFLMFFMIMALGCSYIRVGDDAFDRTRTLRDPSEKSADLIIDSKN